MPVSMNNTTLTFNDATTQTTSGVTSIGTGTGISSTGGKTPTLTNTGVTSVSGAGTVSVSASSGAVTITGTGGSGTVTSVATGNGLQGGTITSSGTLSVACPGFNTVGSYCLVGSGLNNSFSAGTNLSAGNGINQVQSVALNTYSSEGTGEFLRMARSTDYGLGAITGTWKILGPLPTIPVQYFSAVIACRVS